MTMENQLLAEEVRIKATAQKAINSATDVLTSALSIVINKSH
jgi:predicted adenine nucleotide alpha hydrolase (AANH) superfamily ATPase